MASNSTSSQSCSALLPWHTIQKSRFYENGAFLPEITVDAFERLVRNPSSFELRRYRIQGVRRDVYIELARLFGRPAPDKGESLLSVVKPLFRFLRRLPQYCQTTKRLSTRTLGVRAALMHAKEPDQLLFHELPVACAGWSHSLREKLVGRERISSLGC
jgi:hypothetical protein